MREMMCVNCCWILCFSLRETYTLYQRKVRDLFSVSELRLWPIFSIESWIQELLNYRLINNNGESERE